MNRWALCSVLFVATQVLAAPFSVRVVDRDGHPVSGIVVTLKSASGGAIASAPAIMDQQDQRFVPFVLPVQAGTPVRFPNSDSVAHQVYSFSAPKRFELGLYRGKPHPPVTFDKPGVVILGCNIHDKMIGYVYVTDATYFGKTNAQGAWHVEAANASYELDVWSPRLARSEPPLKRTVIVDGAASELIIRLQQPVQAEPAPQTDRKVRDY